jgi:glycosyltransferase involved in cell wall biosynthesis
MLFIVKRLFIASGIFHPEAGGPATYLQQILPALQSKGWHVRLLTFGSGDTQGYPYSVTRIARNFLPLRYARYGFSAWQELSQADLVYAHTIDLPLVTRWRAKAHLPHVMKVVGDTAWERCIRKGWVSADTDVDRFQVEHFSARVAQEKASRSQQTRAMNAVIVPSEYLKQMVVGWGVDAHRVSVVYNALPPMSGQRLSQAQARQQLGLSDSPMLLTAARLTPWKGIDHLISVLPDLPDVTLYVAGDGDDKARLQTLAQPLGQRVVFLGQVERERLYTYMQASDYFALYSGYEGLAHTLLESLRVGTPLIASAKGGNVEVIKDGLNGFLVPYVDKQALLNTLQRAFSADTRQQLSANTHLGMERFTFEYMASATDAILNQALNHH